METGQETPVHSQIISNPCPLATWACFAHLFTSNSVLTVYCMKIPLSLSCHSNHKQSLHLHRRPRSPACFQQRD